MDTITWKSPVEEQRPAKGSALRARDTRRSFVKHNQRSERAATLRKSPTAFTGRDETFGGGLPAVRQRLVCRSARFAKTMLAMKFLVRGGVGFGEPGVIKIFAYDAAQRTANERSLGFDLIRAATRALYPISSQPWLYLP